MKTNLLILTMLTTAPDSLVNALGAETNALPSAFIPAFPGAEGYGAQ